MLQILADDDVSTGQIVAGRYRLSHVVGEGGMGVVWAATHVITEKRCALKFLKPTRATDPRSHHRLIHEARAACRVRHPNVAPVHDVLELPNGVPFIVMDLLEGESLAVRLAREGRMVLGDTLPILLSVVDAVAAAHELGIVHRDLKPDNVFLERAEHDDDEHVRVLDFGIAKLVGTVEPRPSGRPALIPSSTLTTTLSAIGTPSYMAPEQLDPHSGSTIGPEADVWALGVLAFECLTGTRPVRSGERGRVERSTVLAALAQARVPIELTVLVTSMLEGEASVRPPILRVQHALERLARARLPVKRAGRPRTFVKTIAVLGLAAAGVLVSRTVLSRADAIRTAAPAVPAVQPAAAPAVLTTALIEPASPAPSATILPSAPPPSGPVLLPRRIEKKATMPSTPPPIATPPLPATVLAAPATTTAIADDEIPTRVRK